MFRRMLAELVASVPESRGAIFCDHEGENVDYALPPQPPQGAPPLSEFDLKVCGAMLAASWILLRERSHENGAGPLTEVELRTDEDRLLCHSVADGYYIVLLLTAKPIAPRAPRVLREAARALAKEM